MAATATDDSWMETCVISISAIEGTEIDFAGLTESIDFSLGEKDIEGVPLLNGGRITKWSPEGDSSVTFEAYPLQAATLKGNPTASGFFDLLHSRVSEVSSGTTSSQSSGKLIDSTADFVTDGVVANMVVYNTTDGTSANITARDDSNTLSIDSNIFTTGEAYIISSIPIKILNDRNRDKYRCLFLWTNDSTATKAYNGTAENASALRIGLVSGYFTSVKPSFTDGILKFTVVYKCAAHDKSGAGNILVESAAGSNASDKLPVIAGYTASNKFG